jgi:hypothetical protein
VLEKRVGILCVNGSCKVPGDGAGLWMQCRTRAMPRTMPVTMGGTVDQSDRIAVLSSLFEVARVVQKYEGRSQVTDDRRRKRQLSLVCVGINREISKRRRYRRRAEQY